MQHLRNTVLALGVATSAIALTTAIAGTDAGSTPSITPKAMADALHLVMDSDRTIYTRKIVNRLVKKDKVIKASEHFEDDKALVLPAQMFRFGSELVAKRAEDMPDVNFSYSLQSLWPVNKQNAPKTEAEKTGLKYVAVNKGQNYYTEETWAARSTSPRCTPTPA